MASHCNTPTGINGSRTARSNPQNEKSSMVAFKALDFGVNGYSVPDNQNITVSLHKGIFCTSFIGNVFLFLSDTSLSEFMTQKQQG